MLLIVEASLSASAVGICTAKRIRVGAHSFQVQMILRARLQNKLVLEASHFCGAKMATCIALGLSKPEGKYTSCPALLARYDGVSYDKTS